MARGEPSSAPRSAWRSSSERRPARAPSGGRRSRLPRRRRRLVDEEPGERRRRLMAVGRPAVPAERLGPVLRRALSSGRPRPRSRDAGSRSGGRHALTDPQSTAARRDARGPYARVPSPRSGPRKHVVAVEARRPVGMRAPRRRQPGTSASCWTRSHLASGAAWPAIVVDEHASGAIASRCSSSASTPYSSSYCWLSVSQGACPACGRREADAERVRDRAAR